LIIRATSHWPSKLTITQTIASPTERLQQLAKEVPIVFLNPTSGIPQHVQNARIFQSLTTFLTTKKLVKNGINSYYKFESSIIFLFHS